MSDILKILGVIFVCVLFSSLILYFDYKSDAGFLDQFFNNQSLSIMGTMLGTSLASTIFLISQLLNFELSIFKKNVFHTSKKELKQDIIFMITIFFMHFLLMLFVPFPTVKDFKLYLLIIKGANLFLWCLFMSAFLDLTRMLFKIDSITQKIINKK